MNCLKRLPLLALLLAAPLLMAPALDIPEKLSAGTAQWNQSTQSVEVPLAVHTRFATQPDAYFVGLYVIVLDQEGRQVGELIGSHVIPRVEDQRNDGLVEIGSASIPWDRNAGTFSGTAGVCVMAQIFDRTGRPVNHAYTETCGAVLIR